MPRTDADVKRRFKEACDRHDREVEEAERQYEEALNRAFRRFEDDNAVKEFRKRRTT